MYAIEIGATTTHGDGPWVAITEVAPGCHGGPWAPCVSRHRSWEAARRAAARSDRLVAVCLISGRRAQLPAQGGRGSAAGRYGRGATVEALVESAGR